MPRNSTIAQHLCVCLVFTNKTTVAVYDFYSFNGGFTTCHVGSCKKKKLDNVTREDELYVMIIGVGTLLQCVYTYLKDKKLKCCHLNYLVQKFVFTTRKVPRFGRSCEELTRTWRPEWFSQ